MLRLIMTATVRKTQVKVALPTERTERARSILRALLEQYLKDGSPHHIGEHADILDVYLLNDGSAVVDANSAFADAHPSGVLAEELTVASLVITLNANDNQDSARENPGKWAGARHPGRPRRFAAIL